jgi:hypothetical protein
MSLIYKKEKKYMVLFFFKEYLGQIDAVIQKLAERRKLI